MGSLLFQVLNSLGIGLAIVAQDLQILHANQAAKLELRRLEGGLTEDGRLSIACRPQPSLAAAIQKACAGRWAMAALDTADHRVSVGLVPLQPDASMPEAAALLVIGPSQQVSGLALQFFCSEHGLTPAEASVLGMLCEGNSPDEIARQKQVQISTVRAQIVHLRQKARAGSIRQLLQMVTRLPPVSRVAL